MTKPTKVSHAVRNPQNQAVERPGAALKALRIARGWKLADVAKRTGLPISTLSKMENNHMSLSYDKLARISVGLEVDIGELFGARAAAANGGAPNGRRSVTRAGQGRVIETMHYRHIYAASELLNKRFVPVVAELRARSIEEFGELIRHSGEEFAFVLQGKVTFHTELYAPLALNEGDSIYFDSGMGHAYLAASAGPCRIISICSGAESQLVAAVQNNSREAKKRANGSFDATLVQTRGKGSGKSRKRGAPKGPSAHRHQ